MGFVVPLISLGISAYAAVEQKKAADEQSVDIQRQAKAEELSASQRQIDRRRNLLRALSSQNASAGAAGVELSGSATAIAKADIRDATNDLLIDKSNSNTRLRSFRSEAQNLRRRGNAQFASSLASSLSSFNSAGGFNKSTYTGGKK